MQSIFEHIQPYVSTIVLAVVSLLAYVILGAINVLKAKANTYFDTKLTTVQRELLHRIAEESYAYAETILRGAGGEEKFAKALQYTSTQLKKRGISVSAEEIQAAIEKAWLEKSRTRH